MQAGALDPQQARSAATRSSPSGRAPAGSARVRRASRISCKSGRRARRRGTPDLERNRLHGDAIAARENRHALDDVSQLAHVARPVVALEHGHDVRIDLARAEVVARAELGEEVGDELADVLRGARAAPARGSGRRSGGSTGPRETVPSRSSSSRRRLVAEMTRTRDADGLLAAHALQLAVLQNRAAAWPATLRAGRRPRPGRSCRRRPARTCRAAGPPRR